MQDVESGRLSTIECAYAELPSQAQIASAAPGSGEALTGQPAGLELTADYPLIQCSPADLQKLKRLALALREVDEHDEKEYGKRLDAYDDHANPDQVLELFREIEELKSTLGQQ